MDLLEPGNVIFKDRYRKKLWMDCFSKWPTWYMEQEIKFLEWSGSSGSRLPHNLGMDFDIFRICYKW